MGQAVPLDDLPGALVPESDLPDEAKKRMAVTGPVAPEPGLLDEAKGLGTILAVPVAQAAQTVLENPISAVGGAYGIYKGSQLANAAIDKLRAPASPVSPGAVDLRPHMQPSTAARSIPINAPGAPATSPILDASGRPMVSAPAQPVAPSAPTVAQAAPKPAPGIIDRASQVVRQLALDKLAKVGVGAAAALTPGNIGQNYPFPQSGPLRGSEINPATGAPWTKQELDAYRAQYGG